ncbi:MAG: SatD family protein [Methanosarcinaceae archaeon]|nr:SatD family protein [Methanosarcinaceae archaeon]
MKEKFYVLLGDVISSRRISDRERFQNEFEEVLEKINTVYVEDIFANFKILKGIDEIGGVLSTMSNVYKIINEILEQLHPNRIRFVLIFDYIDIGLETFDISKMDGPVFHKASDTLSTLKKSKLMFEMSISDKMIDTAITGQINLILLTKKNWSLKQHQIVREYKRTNNQDDVAKKLGITQQAVSKTLNKIMWKEIYLIEKKLNYIIDDYSQKLHAKGDIK